MINQVELLKKLISFQSITPSDGGGIDFVANLLKDHGFTTYIKDFGEEKVRNLYASYGSITPNICFAGHIDVVPPGDGWRASPFVAHEEEGKIYGRGAVDMKGALACMIASTINFLEKNPNINGGISFLITADEEGEAKYGTKPMLEWMEAQGHKIDFAIVGEPTCDKKLGDIIKIGRRGSVNFKLKVIGTQGHVAYPHLADNPNSTLIRILSDLDNLMLDNGNDTFQPSNLEITSIDTGNPTTNVIPGEVSARINIRFNNEHESGELIKIIESVVAKYTKNYTLESRISAEPFLSKPSNFIKIFSEAVETQTATAPTLGTSGGTSDARFIQNYCPLLEFGLLNETAHKIDEYVEIGDLQKLYDVYYGFLRTLRL
jgi:succinyl-diaminopimelate desuccinylase